MKSVAESVKAGIRFADEEGDGVWRTVNGNRIFIKEGESLDQALANKLNPGAAKPTVFWRGGGTGETLRGQTAADILKYERDELGNADVKAEPGVDLKKVKSDKLVWLTTTKNAAREYGKAEKITLTKFKIIARDGQGGVLVEKLE